MLKSMTACASVEKIEAKRRLSLEIRSYNHRFLDIILRTPHGFLPLEDRIKKKISAMVARGRVEIFLRLNEDAAESEAFEVDEAKARGYLKAVSELKKLTGQDIPVSLELLVQQGGLIKPVEATPDWDAYWQVIEPALDAALGDFDAMRSTEGAALGADLKKRLAFLETGIKEIESASEGLIAHYRKRLKERIAMLVNDTVAVDAGRIEQEAALLADRSDISEEVVRVKSHLNQFQAIIDGDEPAGRKLNFLLQELNREFNTIGSKTERAGVAQRIVDLKAELEKIREQVQNIE